MGEVIGLDISTKSDLEPDTVLTGALGAVDSVLVLGWDAHGDLYIASSDASIGNLLLLVEMARRELLEQAML